MPFTSGFIAKFGVIAAAVDEGSYAIAIIAMVGRFLPPALRTFLLTLAAVDLLGRADAVITDDGAVGSWLRNLVGSPTPMPKSESPRWYQPTI